MNTIPLKVLDELLVEWWMLILLGLYGVSSNSSVCIWRIILQGLDSLILGKGQWELWNGGMGLLVFDHHHYYHRI